jgi:hypothetical protein
VWTNLGSESQSDSEQKRRAKNIQL